MRLAIVMNLAPRKLGSFEGWIAAMCEEARERGHAVDVFSRGPVHPGFARRLEECGAGWYRVEELLESAYRGIRRLASYDVIHLNMFVPRSRMALMAYAAYPARVMFVDHTSGPVPRSVKPDQPLVGLLKRAADTVTMVRVDGVAGVSEYVTERGRRRFGLGKRARTIYNGVDLRRFIPKDEFFDLNPPVKDPARRSLKIVAVAYLIKEKGVDHLVRGISLARNRELELTVVGDGPELEKLKAQAQELGVAGRVHFVGLRDDVNLLLAECDIFVHPAVWEEAFGLTIAEAMAAQRAVVATRIGGIPELEKLKALAQELGVAGRVHFVGLRDDVNLLLAECDIFVHPAVWEEAFGLTIAEAMAAQRAVVATRIGGIPELVEHGRSGLLVEPGNAQELADALDVLSDQPELRKELGQNARARAEQRFSLDVCAREHVEWCEQAAKSPAPKKQAAPGLTTATAPNTRQ